MWNLSIASINCAKSWSGITVGLDHQSLLSFPIVFVLGKLSKKIPKAGGIASFMEKAFDSKAGAITSWILLGSIPIGVPAIALSGAYYFTYIFHFHLQN